MYNGFYNPMLNAQQRLNQMEQQYPQFANNNPMFQNPQPMQNQMQPISNILKGRAVTSIDEAKAAMIDLDGSVFVFPDIANKKIYTKQINLDGTASLNVYGLEEPIINSQPKVENISMVTKEEFDNVVTQLTNHIKILEQKLNSEVINNVQSYANNDVSNAKPVNEQPFIQEGKKWTTKEIFEEVKDVIKQLTKK